MKEKGQYFIHLKGIDPKATADKVVPKGLKKCSYFFLIKGVSIKVLQFKGENNLDLITLKRLYYRDSNLKGLH